jgi:hypothetical protein
MSDSEAAARRRQLLAAVSVLGFSLGMGAASTAQADATNTSNQLKAPTQDSLKNQTQTSLKDQLQSSFKDQTSLKTGVAPQNSLKLTSPADSNQYKAPAASSPWGTPSN